MPSSRIRVQLKGCVDSGACDMQRNISGTRVEWPSPSIAAVHGVFSSLDKDCTVQQSAAVDLEFVFPKGVLSIDCKRCHGKCCNHGDVIFGADELVELRRHAPTLMPFVSQAGPELFEVISFQSRCAFLNDGGDCSLHNENKKPTNCALFPTAILFEEVEGLVCIDVIGTCPLYAADSPHATDARMVLDADYLESIRPHVDAFSPSNFVPVQSDLSRSEIEHFLSLVHQWALEEPRSWVEEIETLATHLGVPAVDAASHLEMLESMFQLSVDVSPGVARNVVGVVKSIATSHLFMEFWGAPRSVREHILWVALRDLNAGYFLTLCQVSANRTAQELLPGEVLGRTRRAGAVRSLALVGLDVQLADAPEPHPSDTVNEVIALIAQGMQIASALNQAGVSVPEIQGVLAELSDLIEPADGVAQGIDARLSRPSERQRLSVQTRSLSKRPSMFSWPPGAEPDTDDRD